MALYMALDSYRNHIDAYLQFASLRQDPLSRFGEGITKEFSGTSNPSRGHRVTVHHRGNLVDMGTHTTPLLRTDATPRPKLKRGGSKWFN